ncbi:PREDICTED: F-box protein SKIP28-like [Brassica oleracea var. oleracea]|uniref:F-box protein SKIP28-like n=1 Tax=Brassica oleracea var. oleracea TaxID=109376 RepID=UPI0006A6FC8D|nr:PREDICTED: F-box protein SKIP28-like [Brassica oleracea var. oleracea]
MRTEEKEKWRSESVYKLLMIVLPYLHSLYEFISVSRVSPALRKAVRDQTMLWTKVVVEPPLSPRLTDVILWEFTSKSAGKLNTLILRKCRRVTNIGLRRVVDANPMIKKLIVTGCTELVPEGIIACVETLTKNNHKLETLHINGAIDLSALSTYLPQEGAIDLEVCPKCDQVRIIPPCSRETCKREGRKAQECRGCWYCVPRCMECAVCLGPDTEVEEAACGGDVVCLACCQALPKCRFCNKPYCTSHSSLRQGNTTTDAAMFACQACDYRTGASASDPIVLD